MKLAVFDLDHTLLPIDSGNRWSNWLLDKLSASQDVAPLRAKTAEGARAYHAGAFDADAFAQFQMSLLAKAPRAELEAWRDEFIERVVAPAVRPEAQALILSRRREGFEAVLATGTHSFVTRSCAKLFGIELLAAAEPEVGPDGEFTGRCAGSHSYGEGKLRLVQTLAERLSEARAETITAVEAYSDSINDLPLLAWAAAFEPAGRAVAVNPDDALTQTAFARGWEVVTLFKKEHADA